MRIEEKKTVVQTVTVGYKCDVCGKETHDLSDNGSFYNFSSYHSDWGNDSEDSHETHDVCSVKCYIIKIKELIKDNEEYPTFQADEKELPFLKQMVAHFSTILES